MCRCEDERMICVDVKMRRCEDEKMIDRPPLLEEPFAQTLSGKKQTKNIQTPTYEASDPFPTMIVMKGAQIICN